MPKKRFKLVTRADDAGSCRSANEAILEAVEAGTVKNVSFMAVGPEIEHAAALLGGRNDICYGLHVTLNAEWETIKWKPLSNSPIFTDENGFFLPFPQETKAQIESQLSISAAIEEQVRGELAAQFGKLRELGLNISYLDEHMGVSWIGLRQQFARFCQTQNLLDVVTIPGLPPIEAPDGDDFTRLEKQLQTAALDSYVWITHPGKIAPDMERLHLKGQAPGAVARERDAERRLLTEPTLPSLFERLNVWAARYDELLKLDV